jgi:hypothetical protein
MAWARTGHTFQHDVEVLRKRAGETVTALRQRAEARLAELQKRGGMLPTPAPHMPGLFCHRA